MSANGTPSALAVLKRQTSPQCCRPIPGLRKLLQFEASRDSRGERRLNALFGSAGAAQSQAAQSTALEQADLVRGVLQRKKPPGL